MTKVTRTTIPLDKLRLHYEGGETQLRVETSQDVVQRYADAMADGAKFPSIVVVTVGDGSHYVADGWHRVRAIELLRARDRRRGAVVLAEVHQAPAGVEPLDYAVRLALGANQKHGLQLTQGDQLRRAEAGLRIPELRGLSVRELAREIGVGKATIGRAKRRLLVAGELVEAHTGEPLPAFVPEEYALAYEKGTMGHPLRWDFGLREEVFAFVGQLKAFDPRAWRYVPEDGGGWDGGDGRPEDAPGETHEGDRQIDHWNGIVEHSGLLPGKLVTFRPFPPNRVVKGLPKVRRIVDPNRVLSDEQRARLDEVRLRKELEAARRRLAGHPDKRVRTAIVVVEEFSRFPEFVDDLWRLLSAARMASLTAETAGDAGGDDDAAFYGFDVEDEAEAL